MREQGAGSVPLETTTPVPSPAAFADWLLAQPLAIVLLVAAIVWLIREIRRERDRADKLQDANQKLQAGLMRANDVSRQGLETSKLLLSMMQGIDDALRRRGP